MAANLVGNPMMAMHQPQGALSINQQLQRPGSMMSSHKTQSTSGSSESMGGQMFSKQLINGSLKMQKPGSYSSSLPSQSQPKVDDMKGKPMFGDVIIGNQMQQDHMGHGYGS